MATQEMESQYESIKRTLENEHPYDICKVGNKETGDDAIEMKKTDCATKIKRVDQPWKLLIKIILVVVIVSLVFSCISITVTVLMKTKNVVLTSCVLHNKTYSSYETIVFPLTITSDGISNIETFQTTGKFTCETPGFYMLSVFITSSTTDVRYKLMRNYEVISRVYMIVNTKEMHDFRTGSATVTVKLAVDDTLYVKSSNLNVRPSSESCLTIVKVG
ncbi:unnamed protein product [Mytilus coruscus]|uniref:C1q domain-containing protein n=1 Tax=Mytilus coruscus TaxID=42192 RepID=A0A6J8E9V0_MYTCO|nr:unnamed protein product [Mytilus coruscus]